MSKYDIEELKKLYIEMFGIEDSAFLDTTEENKEQFLGAFEKIAENDLNAEMGRTMKRIGGEKKEISKGEELKASEAIFGFCAWLVSRNEDIKAGDVKKIIELASSFIEVNKFSLPEDRWFDRIKIPKSKM